MPPREQFGSTDSWIIPAATQEPKPPAMDGDDLQEALGTTHPDPDGSSYLTKARTINLNTGEIRGGYLRVSRDDIPPWAGEEETPALRAAFDALLRDRQQEYARWAHVNGDARGSMRRGRKQKGE